MEAFSKIQQKFDNLMSKWTAFNKDNWIIFFTL